ncbi:hypothetical protein V6N12_019263 [Hibiscus sabdariffa]|uniref:Uncharacterized protein n=1 Tax=Hibiscus sabdariffa TaxID=183260 RepID=A0ABR2C723_9ROSI
MRSLCSVFDVKKQGKPIWEVRTRYWKLREGENRLSVLLEGIPVSGNDFNGRAAILMRFGVWIRLDKPI